MISDFVKGKNKFTYSTGIQKGIMLHRAIDTFTDAHPATHEAKQYFKPAVGTYSGAFTDVIYDHYLALDTTEQSLQQWHEFAENTYDILDSFAPQLPEKFTRILPYMRAQNWLVNYRTLKGIENSFEGVVRRAVYLHNSQGAYDAFLANYDALGACYKAFFPDVKAFVLGQLQNTVNKE